jgi:hypothetical protein
MLTTVMLVILVLALGSHLADSVRVRQEEMILRKLTVEEAHDYYELLRKRARRVRVLRAVTLGALVLAMLAARRRFLPPPAASPVPGLGDGRSGVDPARAAADAAEAAFVRHAAAESLDAAAFQRRQLPGDAQHPFVFEYRPRAGNAEVRKVYVDRDGRAEVHRVARQ